MHFLLACGIVLALEAAFDYLTEKRESPGITQSIFDLTGLYQKVVASPRYPIARYTVVVEINPDKDPSVAGMKDVCDQREMITRLLRNMAPALPNVIVLDKYYEPHTPKPCPADTALIQTVQYLRQHSVPVVIGRRIDPESMEDIKGRYYLRPTLAFEEPDTCLEQAARRNSPCYEAVVNIDPDTRRLPLEWLLYPSREAAEKDLEQSWWDTIALRAAVTYDDNLLVHHPRLSFFIERQIHPFISFLKMQDFAHFLVSQLMPENATTEASDETRLCNLSCTNVSPELRKLSGKIVLVGEINEVDEHPSVVGRMPGVYLQANFIEALLDDRYYRPIPFLDYVFGFAFLVGLELVLIVYRNQWLKLALLIAGLFIVSLAIVYLSVKLLGWYVNPGPVGAAAILIKLLHVAFTRAEKDLEELHTPYS